MRGQHLLLLGGLAIGTAANAQTGRVYTPPRVANGQPDLQGVWDFRTLVVQPLERPATGALKEFLTEEEAAEFDRFFIEVLERDGPFITDDPTIWWDYGNEIVGKKRTFLIIDPPDGRMPALTSEARRRAAERAEREARPAWGPEDRSPAERCIMGGNAGPPILPGTYNNNVQLFQTSDYVALLNEMVHNVRIIPLHVRPTPRLPQWSGHSRGHWDGDTLVVETDGFDKVPSFINSSPNMQLVERFTRVDANTLLYEFTVTDPTTWLTAVTMQVPMKKSDQALYEYACHEGNHHSMTAILQAARAAENAGWGKARKEEEDR